MAILNEKEQYASERAGVFCTVMSTKGLWEDFSQQGMTNTFQVVTGASSLSVERDLCTQIKWLVSIGLALLQCL